MGVTKIGEPKHVSPNYWWDLFAVLIWLLWIGLFVFVAIKGINSK